MASFYIGAITVVILVINGSLIRHSQCMENGPGPSHVSPGTGFPGYSQRTHHWKQAKDVANQIKELGALTMILMPELRATPDLDTKQLIVAFRKYVIKQNQAREVVRRIKQRHSQIASLRQAEYKFRVKAEIFDDKTKLWWLLGADQRLKQKAKYLKLWTEALQLLDKLSEHSIASEKLWREYGSLQEKANLFKRYILQKSAFKNFRRELYALQSQVSQLERQISELDTETEDSSERASESNEVDFLDQVD